VRALTLHRPWPALILHAGKNVENRGWSTSYRGPVLLHSGKQWDSSPFSLWSSATPSVPKGIPRSPDEHPLGIVGVVNIVGMCEPVSRCQCGPWAIRGEHHWKLASARALPEVVPCRGRQGLWIPDPEVMAAVSTQLASQP
jgi:hypothetical protein